jgi:two-component system, LytTR family, sensor histidine kinase AgrC
LTVVVLCTPPIFIGQITSLFFDGNTDIRALVCMASYIPMLFFVYKYLRPLFLFKLRNSQKGWWAFCVIPFSFYALLYVQTIYIYDTQFGLYLYISIMASVLVFSAYVIILRSFKQTWDQLVMQNEQNILSMQVNALHARSESIKQAEEKAVVYCHDLRHHLHLLNGYLVGNDIFNAQKYIAEIEKTIKDTVPQKYCKNNAVNSILSSYFNMAKNKNITVESQINIPEQCFIADMDLCVILSNATENAISACGEIEEINNRKINISCNFKNEKLFIQVENSFAGNVRFVENMPVTERENHGLGTRSITSTVQKYGGIYSFSAENGIFKMNVIL